MTTQVYSYRDRRTTQGLSWFNYNINSNIPMITYNYSKKKKFQTKQQSGCNPCVCCIQNLTQVEDPGRFPPPFFFVFMKFFIYLYLGLVGGGEDQQSYAQTIKYHLLGNRVCQESVVYLRQSQAHFCYTRLCFVLSIFFFNNNFFFLFVLFNSVLFLFHKIFFCWDQIIWPSHGHLYTVQILFF